MFETYTRAAENIILQRNAPDLAAINMLEHRSKGFLWQSDVTDSLKEASKSQLPILERIKSTIPTLESISKKPKQLLARCPKVKSFDVKKSDVNGVSLIRIEFDQEMEKTSRGLSISPQDYEIVKRSSFDSSGKILELTVRFKKGVEYDLVVNAFGRGYYGLSGYPVQPLRKKTIVQ